MTHVRGAGGEWSSCGETTCEDDADGTEVVASLGAHPSASAGIRSLDLAATGPSSIFLSRIRIQCASTTDALHFEPMIPTTTHAR